MNELPSKKAVFILSCLALFLPCAVFASTAYIETNHSEFFAGDTILFRLRIDSENKNINAADGEVLLFSSAEAAALTDINTSGSAFSLWPSKPVPSENSTSISFVGGSPGGLISKDAIIFSFALKLKEAGQITLAPSNIGVYLNDGKGTKDEVRLQNLVIDVLPRETDAPPADDWSAILSNDKTAPEPFEITLGKDPSVFDNRPFISFFTTDAESGVAYYEVQEGARDFVRAESPYVLRDPSLKDAIKVKAIDKAGNERVEEWTPPAPPAPSSKNAAMLVVALLIIVAYALWRIIRRRIKK